MKDFRNYSNRNTNPSSNRDNSRPGSPSSGAPGFMKFTAMSTLFLVLGLFMFRSQSNESGGESSFFEGWNKTFITWRDNFSEFTEAIVEALEEIESESQQVGTPSESGIDPSTESTFEVLDNTESELKATVFEKNIVSRNNQNVLLGMIRNESTVLLGRIKITLTFNNGKSTQDTYLMTSFLRPGESSPFQVFLKDWDGVSEVAITPSPNKFFKQNVPFIEYEMPKGKWVKDKFSLNYESYFLNKSKIPVKFPQIICVFRDKDGSIVEVKSHYIALKEEEYTVPPGGRKDFAVKLFGSKDIPFKTEQYFTYSGTTQ